MTPSKLRAIRHDTTPLTERTGLSEKRWGHRFVRIPDTAGRFAHDVIQGIYSGAVAAIQVPLSLIGVGQTTRLVLPVTALKNMKDVTELPRKMIDNICGLIFAKHQSAFDNAYKKAATLKNILVKYTETQIGEMYNEERSLINNYISTRFTSVCVALAVSIGTVVDVILAPLALALSLALFRQSELLNNYAYKAIVQPPEIMTDFYKILVNFISPSYRFNHAI